MGKKNVVYPYNGMFFGNKRKWSTNISYNMDETAEHYAK